jgi:Transglutaminase-like superfamily
MSGVDRRGTTWRLTAEGWALLMAARLGLRVGTFGQVRAMARRLARPGQRAPEASLEELAAALDRAARAVPRATCLVRALAGAVLLARHGHPASLRIGVAPGRPRTVAHAWVESDGAVLVGADGQGDYTPLPAIEAW